MANDYDISVYQEESRFYFIVLKLMEGRAGVSTPICDSKSIGRQGFDSREQAMAAGLAWREKAS